VVEEIGYLRGMLGEFEPSLQINFGGMKDAEAFRTLELWGTHVLPRLN